MRRLNVWTVAAFLITLAALRIVPTYRVFSATADEATHVGAAMEIYQYHQYQLQRINPPMSRLVLGIAPTLGGMRYDPSGDFGSQLHSVFYGTGKYERNLFLGRVGNLVFLILASVLVFLSARPIDELAALVAVFLFTFEPVILGHSGLATNDAAATAGFALALLACSRWLQKPTLGRAALLGLAWSFAILCKFSNLVFVPLACLAIGTVRLFEERDNRGAILRRAPALLVIPLVVPIAIWAGYAFSVGHVGDLDNVRDAFGSRVEQFIVAHPTMPLPASGFFHGFAHIKLLDRVGHMSYFFGHASRAGWPLYFPATILFKTTLALLLLIVIGAFFTRGNLRSLMIESIAVVILILLFSSESRLDLGIRYVLPVFVPLTMAAAAGATAMLRSTRPVRVVAIVVLAWHAVASITAHPDYFPYFNPLAGRDPSRILVDSNLDWGQDSLRLRKVLRELKVNRVGLAIMGSTDYGALGFPSNYPLDSFRPSTGWVAVSDHVYRMDWAERQGWHWLAREKFRRVGKSIRLFHFAPDAFPGSPDAEMPTVTLLPLAGTEGYRGWLVRQTVTNTGNERVHIDSNACKRGVLCGFDLTAGQSVAITATWPRTQYVMLHTTRKVADVLRTSTTLELANFKVAIPTVRESDFWIGSVTIRNVPVSNRFRVNLRMWALKPNGRTKYTVKVMSDGKTIAERPFATGTDGFVTDTDFTNQFPELAGRESADFVISRETTDADRRLWAFITATDNRSNLPQLFYP